MIYGAVTFLKWVELFRVEIIHMIKGFKELMVINIVTR